MSELALIALVCLAIIAAFAVVRSRKQPRRNVKTGVGAFGWALLFLSSGRMPPPPPQSQIEQEENEKKNREVSRAGEG